MSKRIYLSVLEKLSLLSPLFGRTILDIEIEKRAKTAESITALELYDIIRNEIRPKVLGGSGGVKSPLHIGAAQIITNSKNKIIYTNESAKRLIDEVVHTEIPEDELIKIGLLKELKNCYEVEVKEFQMDNPSKAFNVSLSPIFDGKGKITGVSSVIQDITLFAALEGEIAEQSSRLLEEIQEREKMEEELRSSRDNLLQSSKLASIGEMAGNIAHEINNPLAVIQGKTDIIHRMINGGNFDEEKLSKLSSSVGRMVTRIVRITTGLTSFSRDSREDDFELVVAKDLVSEALVFSEDRLRRQGVDFSIEGNGQDITLECRHAQLLQVLLNFINNSCDSIEEMDKPWIKIKIYKRDRLVRFEITDSGLGIPTENQGSIFQSFFTTKEKGKGTGLGLSITKSIVNDHGGILWLDKESSNTCFIFEIPLTQGKD